MATSAATDSRGAFWAVTCTTGVRPRRPQVRPFGGLEPRDRTRLRRPARHPGPPPSFYLRPGLLPPGDDLLLIPLGRAPGRHLHAPAQPVQQQIQPGQGVVHAEPLADDRGDAGQRPALIGPAPRGRPGVEQRLQLIELGGAEPAAGPAWALGGQRRAAAGGQRAAPAVDRHSGHPEALRHLPVGGPFFDPLRGFQPHLLPPAHSSAVSPPPWAYLMTL